MAAGDSQAWSWEKSGCVSGSSFVRFWYAFSALLNIISKLDDEAAGRCE